MNVTRLGAGPARFVFLHGLFGRGANWTTVATRLSPAGCVLVDLPDHGSSPWTTGFSYPAWAEAVADLLAGLPQPVCLVGHSLGGRVAMMTALLHPGLVERLVVEDAAPGPLDTADLAGYADAMLAVPTALLHARSQARDLMRRAIPDPRVLNFLLQNLRPHPSGGWRWDLNLAGLRRDMDTIGAWPATQATYTGPTLWITGGRSTRTTPGQADALRQLFPRLRHVTVKGAGHWVHADSPVVFTETLRLFAEAPTNGAETPTSASVVPVP
jgi:pimeloyl-ACP methyl ester carboxylesterase